MTRYKFIFFGISISLLAFLPLSKVAAEEVETSIVYSTTGNWGAVDNVFTNVGDGSFNIAIPDLNIPDGAVVTAVKFRVFWKGNGYRYSFHVTNAAFADQDSPSTPCSPTPSSDTTVNQNICSWVSGSNGWSFISDIDNLNGNLGFRGIRFTGTGNSAQIDAIGVTVVYEDDGVSFVELTNNAGTGSVLVDVDQYFTIEWGNLPDNPFYIYFFEDVNDEEPEQFPVSLADASGSLVIRHTYDYSGEYLSAAYVGNEFCTSFTATGSCVFYSDTLAVEVQTLEESIEGSFDNSFSASKYDFIAVNESVTMTYDLDVSMCSIVSRKYYKGYDSSRSHLDSGVTLTTNTGSFTTTFPVSLRPQSDLYYPKIVVTCADATTKTVYLGGSLLLSRAVPVAVFERLDPALVVASVYAVGGEAPENFDQSGSYMFMAEKAVVERYEPVKVKFSYDTPDVFNVTQIRLYEDDDDDYFQILSLTGSKIGNDHYYQYQYDRFGNFQPVIRLMSGSSFINFYLGGTKTPLPTLSNIKVLTTSFVDNFITEDRGLFGYNLAGALRINFESSNPLYVIFAFITNSLVRLFVWMASVIFDFVSALPAYNFLHDLVVPQTNVSYSLPEEVFFIDVDYNGMNVPTYEITRPVHDRAQVVLLLMIKLFLGFFVFRYGIRRFFFHP